MEQIHAYLWLSDSEGGVINLRVVPVAEVILYILKKMLF